MDGIPLIIVYVVQQLEYKEDTASPLWHLPHQMWVSFGILCSGFLSIDGIVLERIVVTLLEGLCLLSAPSCNRKRRGKHLTHLSVHCSKTWKGRVKHPVLVGKKFSLRANLSSKYLDSSQNITALCIKIQIRKKALVLFKSRKRTSGSSLAMWGIVSTQGHISQNCFSFLIKNLILVLIQKIKGLGLFIGG